MAGQYNITVEQGAALKRVATWKDSTNSPVNLSGYTGRMQLRNVPGGTLYLDLTTANGGITFPLTQGQIQIYITAAQTATLTQLDRYSYDLFLYPPSGDPIRLLKGIVIVEESVTA